MTPWITLVGYVAAALVFATFFMRTAINLRMVAIASNVAFIVYSMLAGVLPTLILHGLLLPLNMLRLHEMRLLVHNVRLAGRSDLNLDWLLPYMQHRPCAAGEIIFRQGDTAADLFVIASGRFRITELGLDMVRGEVVGELGVLHPETARSGTLTCVEPGVLLRIRYDHWRVLFFQNPDFGFAFLRLSSQRLFSNLARKDKEILALREAMAHARPPLGHEPPERERDG